MHKKKTHKCQTPLTVSGFLLIEFLISFTILSLVCVFCAYAFFSVIKEYKDARQRLRIIVSVHNYAESQWACRHPIKLQSDLINHVQVRSFEHGIVLPNMPKLKQEWIEIKGSDHKNALIFYMRGRIKED